MKIGKKFENIKKLIFPEEFCCIICGGEIGDINPYNICHKCNFVFNNQKTCSRCGRKVFSESKYCGDCKVSEKDTFYFDSACSCLVYESSTVKLVRDFKFGRKKYLAKPFGALMFDRLKKTGWIDGTDFIVPVPLSKKRLKRRGFNQAKELAVCLGALPPVLDALIKTEDIPFQARLSRAERVINVKDIYTVNSSAIAAIKDKSILLVDDVMTTGATAEECSKILKKHGAKTVRVLTLAATAEPV